MKKSSAAAFAKDVVRLYMEHQQLHAINTNRAGAELAAEFIATMYAELIKKLEPIETMDE